MEGGNQEIVEDVALKRCSRPGGHVAEVTSRKTVVQPEVPSEIQAEIMPNSVNDSAPNSISRKSDVQPLDTNDRVKHINKNEARTETFDEGESDSNSRDAPSSWRSFQTVDSGSSSMQISISDHTDLSMLDPSGLSREYLLQLVGLQQTQIRKLQQQQQKQKIVQLQQLNEPTSIVASASLVGGTAAAALAAGAVDNQEASKKLSAQHKCRGKEEVPIGRLPDPMSKEAPKSIYVDDQTDSNVSWKSITVEVVECSPPVPPQNSPSTTTQHATPEGGLGEKKVKKTVGIDTLNVFESAAGDTATATGEKEAPRRNTRRGGDVSVNATEPSISRPEPGDATGVSKSRHGKVQSSTAMPFSAHGRSSVVEEEEQRAKEPEGNDVLVANKASSIGIPTSSGREVGKGLCNDDFITKRRKQIQEIMLDRSLTRKEKQVKTQELMAGGLPTLPSPVTLTKDDSPVDTESIRRRQIRQIMMDPNLTHREKQVKTQKVMAGGMRSVTPPTSKISAMTKKAIGDHNDRASRKHVSDPETAKVTLMPSDFDSGAPQGKRWKSTTRPSASGAVSVVETSLPPSDPGSATGMGGEPPAFHRSTTFPADWRPGASLSDDSRVGAFATPGRGLGKGKGNRKANKPKDYTSDAPISDPGPANVAHMLCTSDSDKPNAAAAPSAVNVVEPSKPQTATGVGGAPQGKRRKSTARPSAPGAMSVVETSLPPSEPGSASGMGGEPPAFHRSTTFPADWRPGASLSDDSRVGAFATPGRGLGKGKGNRKANKPKDYTGDAPISDPGPTNVAHMLSVSAISDKPNAAAAPSAVNTFEPSKPQTATGVGGAPQGKRRKSTARPSAPGAVSVAETSLPPSEPPSASGMGGKPPAFHRSTTFPADWRPGSSMADDSRVGAFATPGRGLGKTKEIRLAKGQGTGMKQAPNDSNAGAKENNGTEDVTDGGSNGNTETDSEDSAVFGAMSAISEINETRLDAAPEPAIDIELGLDLDLEETKLDGSPEPSNAEIDIEVYRDLDLDLEDKLQSMDHLVVNEKGTFSSKKDCKYAGHTQAILDQVDPTFLVEAKLIKSESSKKFQVAEEMEDKEAAGRKKKGPPCWAVACGGVIMFVLLVLLVMCLLVHFSDSGGGGGGGGNKKAYKSNSNLEDSAAKPFAMDQLILSLLPDSTTSQIDHENNTAQAHPTPQTLAFQWLLADPNIESYPGWRKVQRFALATIYYSTGGEHSWIDKDNWMSYDHHENDWFYATMPMSAIFDDVFGFLKEFFSDTLGELKEDYLDEMKHLWLFNNNLEGTIPPEIGLLTHLVSADFVNNPGIVGSIPTQIGLLTDMAILGIHFNSMGGPIPSEIGALTRLLYLSAWENSLSGFLPSEVGLCKSLWQIELDHNRFSGQIPTEFGTLTDMFWVRLSSNQLTGPVPTELGLLTNMQAFDGSFNLLSGTLPSEIGLFSMVNADTRPYIDHAQTYLPKLVQDSLTGSQMEMLRQKLSETIHIFIPNTIELESNMLTGTIPSCLSGLAMKSGNCLDWTQGSSMLCNRLRLGNNDLTGTVPSLPTGIEEVNLSFNRFEGTIPTLQELWLLRYFDASHNEFTGTMPLLPYKLISFDASDNELTGHVPKEVGRAVWRLRGSLEEFDVSGNSLLTGVIPFQLCDFPTTSLGFDCSDTLCGCSHCPCL